MDSKVDKQIRRYLKRISTKVSQADAYNSYHYTIDYGDGLTVHVRFSDHLRPEHSKEIIDIVKMNSDVYIIGIKNLRYSTTPDRVLGNLKSLMLIAPELARYVKTMARANDKMSQKIIKLGTEVDKEKRKLRKQYSEAEELFALYDEIAAKDQENKNEILRLQQTVEKKDKEIAFLKKRIDQLEIQINSINSLANKIVTATAVSKSEINLSRRNE